MKRIYMDYAATTYMKQEVVAAMLPYFGEKFGNPSGIYGSAREAKQALEDARATIANLLNASSPKETYFTSGGTEGDNWAIRSIAIASAQKGRHIITSNAEHHAVLNTCVKLSQEGFDVTYLPVDCNGMVNPDSVTAALREDTVLVSIMSVNNEVGIINPIEKISDIVRKRGICFHTDAVAAAGHINLDASKVDLMTISAHKFYGPKGVGALYVNKDTKIKPMLVGGMQEREHRAGTENVAGAVGMAAALLLANKSMCTEEKRLFVLRERFEALLLEKVVNVVFNGRVENRLAGYSNICLPVAANAALVALDMAGIECSSGSACMTGGVKPSHVLTAMGLSEQQARHALRFTLGAGSTAEHIEYAVNQIKRICKV